MDTMIVSTTPFAGLPIASVVPLKMEKHTPPSHMYGTSRTSVVEPVSQINA
jgi:hypothetical protein